MFWNTDIVVRNPDKVAIGESFVNERLVACLTKKCFRYSRRRAQSEHHLLHCELFLIKHLTSLHCCKVTILPCRNISFQISLVPLSDAFNRSSDARYVEMAFSHPRVGGGAQLCWEGAIGVHWRDAYAESIRQWNESDLKGYIAASQDGDFAKVQGGEKLDDQQLIMERVMLGLRTAAGVSEDFLRKACDTALIDDALTSGNLIRIQDGNIRIPENRFFISDNIISSII